MSKDDFETGQTLLNPYIEIEDRIKPQICAYVNVSTFEKCLDNLLPLVTDKGPNMMGRGKEIYTIYGVVGRTVTSPHCTGAYLNITESSISRTLMGFLHKAVLNRKLPKTYRALNS